MADEEKKRKGLFKRWANRQQSALGAEQASPPPPSAAPAATAKVSVSVTTSVNGVPVSATGTSDADLARSFASEAMHALAQRRYRDAVTSVELSGLFGNKLPLDRAMDLRLLRRIYEQAGEPSAALRSIDEERLLAEETEVLTYQVNIRQSIAATCLRLGSVTQALELIDDVSYLVLTAPANMADYEATVLTSAYRKCLAYRVEALFALDRMSEALTALHDVVEHGKQFGDLDLALRALVAATVWCREHGSADLVEDVTPSLIPRLESLRCSQVDLGPHLPGSGTWCFGRSAEAAIHMSGTEWSFRDTHAVRNELATAATLRLLSMVNPSDLRVIEEATAIEDRIGVCWPWYRDEVLFLV